MSLKWRWHSLRCLKTVGEAPPSHDSIAQSTLQEGNLTIQRDIIKPNLIEINYEHRSGREYLTLELYFPFALYPFRI